MATTNPALFRPPLELSDAFPLNQLRDPLTEARRGPFFPKLDRIRRRRHHYYLDESPLKLLLPRTTPCTPNLALHDSTTVPTSSPLSLTCLAGFAHLHEAHARSPFPFLSLRRRHPIFSPTPDCHVPSPARPNAARAVPPLPQRLPHPTGSVFALRDHRRPPTSRRPASPRAASVLPYSVLCSTLFVSLSLAMTRGPHKLSLGTSLCVCMHV